MAAHERQSARTRGLSARRLPLDELLSGDAPVVLKGLVDDWPLVQAGLRSTHEAMNYLRSFYNGKTVGTSHGDPRSRAGCSTTRTSRS